MDRRSEIAQLERELADLRAGFVSMQRGARYLRNFFAVVLIGALILTGYSLVTMNIPGFGAGAIVTSMSGAIMVWNNGEWIHLGDLRRIGERISRLEATEIMIRERERRLAELKESQA